MHPASTSRVLGFDEASIERARSDGHVVGRGEGFISREWRAGRPLLAVHTDEADAQVTCVVPFVAGFPWREWLLLSVRAEPSCPHCTAVRLRSEGVELVASIPDYAARRKMLPVSLLVQASVLVVVEEWRPGEALPALVTAIEEGAADAVVVSGRVASTITIDNEATGRSLLACELTNGDDAITVVGPAARLEVGEVVSASGHALARIGAPVQRRGG